MPTSVTAVGKKSYILLAATPDQAKRLAKAQDLDGTISVALCTTPSSKSGDQLDASRVDAILSKDDHAITVRDLLHLPPLPAPPAPPERIVVEQVRGTKIDYVVFTQNDERIDQERARQASLPATANATAAKPVKKCKNCNKGIKAQGGPPTPGPTPMPAPAPQGRRIRRRPNRRRCCRREQRRTWFHNPRVQAYDQVHNSNEVLIQLDIQETSEQALDKGKIQIIQALEEPRQRIRASRISTTPARRPSRIICWRRTRSIWRGRREPALYRDRVKPR